MNQEQKTAFRNTSHFAVQSTPYYVALAQAHPPLQKIILPDIQEGQKGRQALKDPLGEENHSPVKHIIHRYPDRVVFLITDYLPYLLSLLHPEKIHRSRKKKIIPQQEYQKAPKLHKK